jgi:hypothetical protein
MQVVNQFVANIEQLLGGMKQLLLICVLEEILKMFLWAMCIPKRMLTTTKVVMGI